VSSPDQAYANLCELRGILDGLGVHFWLDGGTLLGVWRDGDFCDGDHDDIDLSVWAGDVWKIPDLIDQAKAAGFRLYHHWQGDPRAPGQAQEVAFERDGLKVDVFFFEVKRDVAWHLIYRKHPDGVYYGTPVVAPLFLLSSFVPVSWRDAMWQVPANADGYLAWRYGDWRTPVHRDEWTSLDESRFLALDPSFEFWK
jgi:hypothetical protein